MARKIGVVALAVIIILAVVIMITRGRRAGEARDEGARVMRDVINVETLEIVQVATGEFENMRHDPATGYRVARDGRKLATPMDCFSCGAKIPPHPVPEVAPGEPLREEMRKWEYRCPKCGGPAYQEGRGPRPDAM